MGAAYLINPSGASMPQNGRIECTILNEAEFLSALHNEMARYAYSSRPFSLLLISGREAGALDHAALGQSLRARLRVTDEIGMLAGMSLGMLLPYTAAEGAAEVAEVAIELSRSEFAPPYCEVLVYPKCHAKIEARFHGQPHTREQELATHEMS